MSAEEEKFETIQLNKLEKDFDFNEDLNRLQDFMKKYRVIFFMDGKEVDGNKSVYSLI